MELPRYIHKAVNNYQPVEIDGVVLYPVRVAEYEDFLIARSALEVLHQSLPVALMRVPLLSALYQMDYEAARSGQPVTGLFLRALLGLALALRLGEGKSVDERVKMFRIMADPDEPTKLTEVTAVQSDGNTVRITPSLYAKLRPVIAAQNGVKLESDRADPDLVQAEKDLAEMNGVSLDISIDALVSSIAALSGVDEAEIEDWAILKLTRRQRSLHRVLDYVICGIGQVNGTTWKGGNPYPSPFFDKKTAGFGAHMALGAFAGGAGERAVANAGQKVN